MNKHLLAIAIAIISVNTFATGNNGNHEEPTNNNDGNHEKPFVVDGSVAGNHYLEQWQNNNGYRASGTGTISYKAKGHQGASGNVGLTITPTKSFTSNVGNASLGSIEAKADMSVKLTGYVSRGKIYDGESAAGVDVGVQHQTSNQSLWAIGSTGTETTGIGARSHEPVSLSNESLASGLANGTYHLTPDSMAADVNIELGAENDCTTCQTSSAATADIGVSSFLIKGPSFISGYANGTGYINNSNGPVDLVGSATVDGSIGDEVQVNAGSTINGSH